MWNLLNLLAKLTPRTVNIISIISCVLVFGGLGGYLANNYWQGFSRDQALATKGITTTAMLDEKYTEVTRKLNNIETEKMYDDAGSAGERDNYRGWQSSVVYV